MSFPTSDIEKRGNFFEENDSAFQGDKCNYLCSFCRKIVSNQLLI